MEKRLNGILILLILVIFASIGLTSAVANASCGITLRENCGDTVVMGISDTTNAHGELYNQNNYDYTLCCNFENMDVKDSCSNRIIGLSSSTNAHAEAPNQGNYNNDVCYGDLECRGDLTDCTTDNNYPLNLLNLSGDTNAHIGWNYDTKICCKSPSTRTTSTECQLNGAYWSLDGNSRLLDGDNNGEIDDVIGDGSTIRIVVNGSPECDGGTASFTAQQDETGNEYDAEPAGFVLSDDGSHSKAVAKWTTPDVPSITFGTNEMKFNFTASTSSKIISNSTLLVVEDTESDSGVNTCNDYKDSDSCWEDAEGIGEEATNNDACPGDTKTCECQWDSGNSICDLKGTEDYTEPGTQPSRCDIGTTLCLTNDTSQYYCHPGDTCPTGHGQTANGMNGCEFGEGCSTYDCQQGDEDTCVEGATCTITASDGSDGYCNIEGQTPKNVTSCDNGYDLCLNQQEGLTYCYPGECSEVGDTPVTNNDGVCDIGDSCSSSDCSDGDTAPCSGDAQCQSGLCTAPYSEGKCTYTYSESGDDCSDGLLEYSWTATWESSNNDPQPDSCSDGSRVVECPAQVQLPFFNTYSLIATVIVIALTYVIVSQLRKQKKNSKKHKKK